MPLNVWKEKEGRWQRTPIRDERIFIPNPKGLDDVYMLRTALVDLGHSPATVNGITGWLIAKALGEPDTTSSATRARYRRILRTIEVDFVDDDDAKRSIAA